MFTQLARQAVLSDMSWEITVDAWVRGLPVRPAFKDDVLYPWITATIGCSRADALRASARSILQTFALAFPANIADGATTYTSKIGLQGNLRRLLDRSPTARVHVRTPTQALSAEPRRLVPADPGGPARALSVRGAERACAGRTRAAASRCPPSTTSRRCSTSTGTSLAPADPHRRGLRAPRSPQLGGLQRRASTVAECEGSAWLGALQEAPASGAPVHVFKSWAERRRADPKHILLERRFRHPLINRSAIRAARALGPLQGRRGLYFSGQYTTGMDLQESAVYSAMGVAEALAPGSETLASLKARLTARGLAGISYDL